MATPTQSSTEPSPPFMNVHHDEDEKCSCKESNKTIIPDKLIVSELPRERGWLTEHIHLYNGFWYPPRIIHGLLALHQHFKPHPNDVLLASFPKSGTTWLKALLFTIVNRAKYNGTMHPLLTSNPHDLVPWLEAYASSNPTNPRPNSSLFHTHLAYPTLPEQIHTSSSSSCRIVYVFRDPKDVLVSCWHFLADLRPKHLPPISLQEAFDQFSRGASPFGPFWDHVAGYFKASVQSPDKVLFVRYEDLKRDTVVHVKRVAEFLGHPFSAEEEKQGVVREITDLCSFEKLSSLEVNKNGSHHEETGSVKEIRNNVYFRKGEIGDSKNHLSEKMMEILDQMTQEKFKDLGLLV